MKRVRFWVYVNDTFVRISLTDGQALTHRAGGATDEGWSSEANVWALEGNTVRHECYQDGRDCDGRLSSEYVTECPVADLGAHRISGDDEWALSAPALPSWQKVEASQRDYSAEAMGY